MARILERARRLLAKPEPPEHMTAAQFREWFRGRESMRSELAERAVGGSAWALIPTRRSTAILNELDAALGQMDADPHALRDYAAREGISITD